MVSELTKRFLSSIFLIPLTFFVILKGSWIFNFFILLCLLLSIYEWNMMTKFKKYNFLGIIFLFFSFLTVYLIRNSNSESSLFIFLYIIFICISTDIGGYVFGKLFKGPKLTKYSPNKTIAGSVGGYLFSLFISILYFKYLNIINLNFIEFYYIEILVTLFLSTISQIGDIIVSFFKRLANVKDTGRLIPGHGGILDRIDGMIFSFPFFFILKTFFKIL